MCSDKNNSPAQSTGADGAPLQAPAKEAIGIIGSYTPGILEVQEAENHKANRKLRNRYSRKAYDLAVGVLCFWGIALSATGIVFVLTGKQMLSDNILIAITTGATINVLAAFLGVIRGLFPSPPKEKESKKSSPTKEKAQKKSSPDSS